MLINNFIKFNMNIIVAMTSDGLIGLNNKLAWNTIPEDMKYFSDITKNNIVIMGYNTWESLPEKHKPLSNRINIVLSKEHSKEILLKEKDLYFCKDLNDLYELLNNLKKEENERKIFIIGGSIIYKLFLSVCEKIYITEIKLLSENSNKYDKPVYFLHDISFMNTYWNINKENEWKESKNKDILFKFIIYDKK